MAIEALEVRKMRDRIWHVRYRGEWVEGFDRKRDAMRFVELMADHVPTLHELTTRDFGSVPGGHPERRALVIKYNGHHAQALATIRHERTG